jgi:uncharacterized repeat protein (TIGR04076 family)
MAKVRITAIRQTVYPDLMAKYENPIQHPCSVQEGQQWISINGNCPDGLCPSAWTSMQDFVKQLAQGKGNFYDNWMQNPMSAMISCNDGFRPFSFYLEAIEEPSDAYDEHTKEDKEHPLKRTSLPISKADERLHKLIAAIGDKTMPRRQIIAYLDLKQRSRRNFMDNYLRPAIDKGYVVLAKPDSPNSPEQAYRLSTNGLELLQDILAVDN